MDRTFEGRTDAQLLRERRRPEDAFAAFYRRHSDAVVRYVASRGLDPHAAADVVSATFFAALHARRRYRPQNPTALPWLLTIATTQIADSARRSRRDDRLRRRIAAHDPPPLTDADTDGLAADDPDVERGTSCTSAPDFERYGLEVRVGRVAAAAVPPGAPAPRRVGRFPAQPLAVNDDDIAVVTDLKADQALALRYKPGVSRTDGRSVPRKAPRGVCTDGRRVDRPGDCYRPGMTDPADMCARYSTGSPPGPCVIPGRPR